MFARSERAFFEVISKLTPTHVLALGYRLWEQMPAFESECRPLQVGARMSDCGRYASIDKRHRALAVRFRIRRLHTGGLASASFSISKTQTLGNARAIG